MVPLSLNPKLEPRALLNCVLRDGDTVGTDDAGRTALLLMVDPWTLDRLLAFDADAAEREDGSTPYHRGRGAAGPIGAGGAGYRHRPVARNGALCDSASRPGARDDAAAHVDRAGTAAVLPGVPEGPALWRQLHQR